MSNITKNALAESLKKILIKKSITKITIEEIVNLTGVNRQTFYYHFDDIYDLVKWIYKNDIFLEIRENNNYDNWEDLFELLLDSVANNKIFISKTYNLSSLNKFIYDLLYNQINNFIIVNNISSDKKEIEFISKFYSYAIIGIIYDWIKNNMKENKKDIIRNIKMVISTKNRQY